MLERPQYQPLDQTPPEAEEDRRTPKPEHDERRRDLDRVGAGDEYSRGADHQNGARRDEPELEEQAYPERRPPVHLAPLTGCR
jgi:hypothetical protein